MITPLSEQEIIGGLKNGDNEALAAAYTLYFRRLQYFAFSIVKDREVARDYVVDAFIKLRTSQPQLEAPDNLRAFLFSLVRNACLNHLKITKRHRDSRADIIGLTDEPKTIELAIYEAEVIAAIYAEIDQLPDQCRHIVKASFIEGKKVEVIAEEMGLAAQTVRNQKARGIKLIKTSLVRNNLLSAAALGCALNWLSGQ